MWTIERFSPPEETLAQREDIACSSDLTTSYTSAIPQEYARRAAPITDIVSDCAPQVPGIYMSDISSFYMLLPFFLIGVGEVLVNPCLYFFVYDQAPPRTRSLLSVCHDSPIRPAKSRM